MSVESKDTDADVKLTCDYCNDKFTDVIKLVPECGASICQECDEDLQELEDPEFKCSKCKKVHIYPDGNLPLDQKTLEALKKRSEGKCSAQRVEELKQSLNEINSKIESIKGLDEEKCVNEYCDELRNELVVTVESFIEHLRKIEKDLLAQIQVYQYKATEKITEKRQTEEKEETKFSDELENFQKKILEFTNACQDYIDRSGTAGTNAEIDANYEPQVKRLKLDLQFLENKLKNGLFKQSLNFRINQSFLRSMDHLGRLVPNDAADDFDNEKLPKIETKLSTTLVGQPKSPVTQLLFLKNGNLASCQDDARITIWNPRDNTELFELSGHSDKVVGLVPVFDDLLASASKDKTINIWNLKTKSLFRTLTGHEEDIESLRAHKYGYLVSSSKGKLLLWNPCATNPKKQLVSVLTVQNELKKDPVKFGVLSNGMIMTVQNRKKDKKLIMKIWNPFKGTLEAVIEDPVTYKCTVMTVLSDDSIAAGFVEGTVKIINLLNKRQSRYLDQNKAPPILLQELRPNYMLIYCSNGKDISSLDIWNTEGGRKMHSIAIDNLKLKSLSVSTNVDLIALGNQNLINIIDLDGLRKQKAVQSEEPDIPRFKKIETVDQDSNTVTLIVSDSEEENKNKIAKGTFYAQNWLRAILPDQLSLKNKSVSLFDSFGDLKRNCQHENLIKFLDHSTNLDTDSIKFIILENYFELNTLKQTIMEKSTLINKWKIEQYEKNVLKWLGQMADALCHLHQFKLRHGKLNPNNVFMIRENMETTSVKLGPIDLIDYLYEQPPVAEIKLQEVQYYSPERIKSENSGLKDDCWSLGCVLYEMETTKPAFSGNTFSVLFESITNRVPPKIGNENYEELYSVLMRNEETRINASNIVEKTKELHDAILLSGKKRDNYMTLRKSDTKKIKYQIIEPSFFNNWQNSVINLSNNGLRNVLENHFHEMNNYGKIQEIWLDNNQLVYIEDIFENLVNLRVLRLNSNQLTNIDHIKLRNQKALNYLDISDNKLTHIKKMELPESNTLSYFDLSNNKIKFIGDEEFSGLTSLQVLKLNNNEITKCDSRLFSDLRNLLRLNMAFNQLTSIEKLVFQDTKSLIELKLNNNKIDSIKQGAFASLANLRELDLSCNKLKELDDELFCSMINLKTLNLGSNELTNVNKVKFGSLKKLNKLVLKQNELEEIDMNIFNECVRLGELNLQDNHLREIKSVDTFNRPDGQMKVNLSGNEEILRKNVLEKLISQVLSGLKSEKLLIYYDHINRIKVIENGR